MASYRYDESAVSNAELIFHTVHSKKEERDIAMLLLQCAVCLSSCNGLN